MRAEIGKSSVGAGVLAKLGHALVVVGVFGLAGPPVGGVVAWTSMGAATMRSPLPFITGSYGEGLLLALGTGILAAAAVWLGKTSWTVPVVATLLLNAAFIVGSAAFDPRTMTLAGLGRTAGVFVPSSLAAAVVCWFASLWLLRFIRASEPGH